MKQGRQQSHHHQLTLVTAVATATTIATAREPSLDMDDEPPPGSS